MVAYGNSLREASRADWESAYLDYEKLKHHLKDLQSIIVLQAEAQPLLSSSSSSSTSTKTIQDIGKDFYHDLYEEIEKVSLFTLKTEGDIADAIGTLRFPQTFHDEDSIPRRQDPRDTVSVLGVELLHLLRFICINATAIRKIMKKYRKLVFAAARTLATTNMEEFIEQLLLDWDPTHAKLPQNSNVQFTPDAHLQLLANSTSIDAIHTSLVTLAAHLKQHERENWQQMNLLETESSQLRLQFVLTSIQTLRASANVVNSPFDNYLSRKAMIKTGSSLGDIEGSYLSALNILLKFEPDSIFRLSDEDLIRWDSLIGKDGVRLDAHAPSRRHLRSMSSIGFGEDLKPTASFVEEEEDTAFWGGVNQVSMALNFVSTLLYTINYYIVAPNANRYSVELGHDGAYGATLIGASSFAALFAAFLYSLWYTRSSFKSALVFSSIMPLIGNLMYGLAISYDSMTMAVFGRILCGFGSAEVVNRQLISACVSYGKMTRASALFVGSSASGMSLGPLFGSLFDIIAGRDVRVDLDLPFMPRGGIIYDHITGPAFFMSVLWLLQLSALVLFFKEPERVNAATKRTRSDSEADDAELSYQLINRHSELTLLSPYGSETIGPVLTASELFDSGRLDPHLGRSNAESENKPNVPYLLREIKATLSLAFGKPALPITFLLFCYIEMADEVLISSCSMITRRYFGWHGAVAGFLIASLGALVLPADFVVERASHVHSERRILKFSLLFIIAALIFICNYEGLYYDILGEVEGFVENVQKDKDVIIGGKSVNKILNEEKEFPYDWNFGNVVYVVFLSAVFMGTIIMEGVDTSLMAKFTPARLNDSMFNSGLLATLIGTLGRVFADLLITMSALLDVYTFVDFCNATFMPLLLLAVLLYILVDRHYNDLLIS